MTRMQFFILVLALSAIVVPTVTGWRRRRRRPPPCTVNNWSDWACAPTPTPTCSDLDCIFQLQPQPQPQTCQQRRTRTRSQNGHSCPSLQERKNIIIANWGNWGHCSNTCGLGSRTRRRSVEDPPNCGGASYSCDQPLSETQSCYDWRNTDCRVSSWSPFGCVPNNGRCGPGKATKRRLVEQAPTCRGRACPSLTEEISCNAIACTCTVNNWSGWTCSPTCQKRRSRTISRHGLSCFSLENSAGISITNWGNWGHCSNTCGLGSRTRRRSVEDPPNCGGASYSCDQPLSETQSCYDFRDTDCRVSAWSSFGNCVPKNGKCGPGKATRRRLVEQAPTCRGRACPSLTEEISCNAIACTCTVNNWSGWTCSPTCQKRRSRTISRHGLSCFSLENSAGISITNWGNWGHCSNTCGLGSRTRRRSVEDPPNCGGASYSCDQPLSETQSCYDFRDTDCRVSAWSSFGNCVPKNGKCGPGKATRRRHLEQAPTCRGRACPSLTEVISCNAIDCTCTVGNWSIWACSETCQKVRSRNETREGLYCPFGLKETASIIFANWGNWGQCSNTCGHGSRIRRRSVQDPPSCGGAPYSCNQPLSETQSCYNSTNTDCRVSAWSSFGNCVPENGKCGPGKATRRRHIEQAPTCRGIACPSLTEEISCNAINCTCTVSEWSLWTCSETCQKVRNRTETREGLNCSFGLKEKTSIGISNWGNWGHCTNTCGQGTRTRQRSVEDSPNCRGAQYSCEKLLSETQSCRNFNNTDCKVSPWGPLGPCVPINGQCKATRHRLIKQAPTCRGRACPPPTEDIPCYATACACEVSEWSMWTCSERCQKLRTRTVTRQGLNCPSYLNETASIRNSQWGNWGHCSSSCGKGTKIRQRTVEDPPNCGGAPYSCHKLLNQTKRCFSFKNIDCKVSTWTAFGDCVPDNGQCGPGNATRHRMLLQLPFCQGKLCPPLAEQILCNATACPIPCTLTEWTEWSNCNQSCGYGHQSRNRSIITPAKHGGACDRELEKQQLCNIGRRIDCQVTEWTPWTRCNGDCENRGYQVRGRQTTRPSLCGGRSCPDLYEINICPQECACDECILSSWSKWSSCSCDGETEKRRSIIRHSTCLDKPCPTNLFKSKPCENSGNNCQYTKWTQWSSCVSKQECGEGQKMRKKTPLIRKLRCGKTCKNRKKTEKCFILPSPCELTEWTQWTSCSKLGLQFRGRKIVIPAKCGGSCGVLSEFKLCRRD